MTRVLALGLAALWPVTASASDAAERVRADAKSGKPLVAHVVVALCDNVNQGIVPVPKALGNGQDPGGNLYWGAAFGVRTYFSSARGWKRVQSGQAPPPGVLERAVFRSTRAPDRLFVVADAWDGARIREAVAAFLEMASGRRVEETTLDGQPARAGGGAHVVAFVGHNGLMDFEAPALAAGADDPPRAAMVLACASRPYFEPLLQRGGAYPLLLTTGLMAPEAYSLEAAIRAWFAAPEAKATRQAAAEAYGRFQRCGLRAARRLFGAGE
jgi:hypothetical protein